MLWFAWKFLSLWYQIQQESVYLYATNCCDLLENFYLCGIKYNLFLFQIGSHKLWFAWKFLSLWYQIQQHRLAIYQVLVVICLKISIFVVSNTTSNAFKVVLIVLWFAWKFLSLWYQIQLYQKERQIKISCDLLENFYLCGIKYNKGIYQNH